jgi:hypothetical protein
MDHYYEILGVPNNADTNTIKKAYHKSVPDATTPQQIRRSEATHSRIAVSHRSSSEVLSIRNRSRLACSKVPSRQRRRRREVQRTEESL